MRMFRPMAVATVLLLTLLASGCGRTTNSAIGTWTDQEGEAELELSQEGEVSGTDGCNRLTGSWDQQGDTVTFHGLASTLMACPDTDVWLTNPATATVSGDTMTIYDADDDELGELSRQ